MIQLEQEMRNLMYNVLRDTMPEGQPSITQYSQQNADLNYNNAILDGSWPQAVEILERALVRAKKIEADRIVIEKRERNYVCGAPQS